MGPATTDHSQCGLEADDYGMSPNAAPLRHKSGCIRMLRTAGPPGLMWGSPRQWQNKKKGTVARAQWMIMVGLQANIHLKHCFAFVLFCRLCYRSTGTPP